MSDQLNTIHKRFRHQCKLVTDINEHLPTLYRLARGCQHVTEMGVRAVVSTWALLAAKPNRFVCYDIGKYPDVDVAAQLAAAEGINFVFHEKNVTLIPPIEPTDFLFIDTLHTYSQLRHELSLHGNQARRYLAFHDTETYGRRNENGVDSTPAGIVPAINEFVAAHPHWRIKEIHRNNNGLVVLQRTH